MNILVVIFVNVFLASIIGLFTMLGSRGSWGRSAINFALIALTAVGSFALSTFVLQPVIFEAALANGSAFLSVLSNPGLLFFLVMAVVSAIVWPIVGAVRKSFKVNKFRGAKGTRRIMTKTQLKHGLRANQTAWRQKHKTSRAFGGIIGFLNGVLISFVLMTIMGMVPFYIALTDISTASTFYSVYSGSFVGLFDLHVLNLDYLGFINQTSLALLVP